MIQAVVRHDVTAKFPQLADRILGEESAQFTNQLGESLTVAVQERKEDTADLLERVLAGNTEAAALLAERVHARVEVPWQQVIKQHKLHSLYSENK